MDSAKAASVSDQTRSQDTSEWREVKIYQRLFCTPTVQSFSHFPVTGCDTDRTGCDIDMTGCDTDRTGCDIDMTGCDVDMTGCDVDMIPYFW